MRIFIRFHGEPVLERELSNEKVYQVGRSTDCEICYSNPRISRLQGTLEWREGSWVFVDVGTEKGKTTIHCLDRSHKVSLPNGLEIVTEDYVDSEATVFSTAASRARAGAAGRVPRVRRWHRMVLASFALSVVFGIGGAYIYNQKDGMSAHSVLDYAKPRTVVFEFKRDESVLEKIVAASGLAKTDFKESLGYCTGFVVAPGIVMTANHCVFDEVGRKVVDDGFVRDHHGKEHAIETVLGFDPLLDIALLKVSSLKDSKTFTFADSTRAGDKVFTVGNVHGEGIAIRDGLVASETEEPGAPEVKYLRFSAGASPGNSGGPLLNAHGEVVGLISKKTFAENYNIAIRISDLKQAMSTYVDDVSPKKITLTNKNLVALKQPQLIGLFSDILKVPIPGGDQYGLNNEGLEDTSTFNASVEVPAKMEDISEKVQAAFNAWMIDLQRKQNEKAIAENKPGLTWEEQVTKEIPLIVPLPGDNKAQLSQSNGRIDFRNHQPKPHSRESGYSTMKTYKKTIEEEEMKPIYQYPFGGSGYTAELELPKSEKFQALMKAEGIKVYGNTFDEDLKPQLGSRGSVDELLIEFGETNPDKDARTKKIGDTLAAQSIPKNGATVSLIEYPFIRPNVKMDFKIDKLPEPFKVSRTLQDKNGREWKVYSSDVFTLVELHYACLDERARTYCRSVSGSMFQAKVPDVAWANLANTELSDLTSHLDFVPTMSLKGGGNVGETLGQPKLADFEFKETNGSLQVTMKSIGKSVTVGNVANVHQVRFIPGLMYDEKLGKGKWVALAVEILKKDGQKYANCTTGVDFADYHFLGQAVDQWSDEILKMRGPASEEPKRKKGPPTFYRKSTGAEFMGHKTEVFGVCNELKYSETKKALDYGFKLESWRPSGL